jgi:hypothetical protein
MDKETRPRRVNATTTSDPEPEELFSEEVPDPFAPETLRLRAGDEVQTSREVNTVAVYKPRPDQFFRVHPEAEYQVDTSVLDHESGRGRETFLVAPYLRSEVRAITTGMRSVRLFTAVTKRGSVFLWPIPLCDSETASLARTWYESQLAVADLARDYWVKLVTDRESSSYQAIKALGDLGQPQWLDVSFRDLLHKAFRSRLIDSLDHIVIRELNGEV